MSEVITDNTQVILNYEQENEQLKARVARLEEAIMTKYPTEKCEWVGDYIKMLKQVLNETPKQSLADIKAAAIINCKLDLQSLSHPKTHRHFINYDGFIWMNSFSIKEYADRLKAEGE